MNKILKFIMIALVCTSLFSIGLVTYAANNDVSKQDEYKQLKDKAKKQIINKENPKDIKKTYVEMDKLGFDAMSDEDIEKRFKSFIVTIKLSLEDTKKYSDMTDADTIKFVEKTEAKLAKLELQLKSGKISKAQFMTKMYDWSDVIK